MANKIYLSNLMTNGASVTHSFNEGGESSLTASVRIPAGDVLTTTDKIYIARYPTGVIFNSINVQIPDLDSGTTLTLNVGYDRPLTNPGLPFNASTNPYITGAIGTADPDFFEAAATTGQAGGTLHLEGAGFTVTTFPAAAGYVDVSITPAANATGAASTDGQINFTLTAFLADAQTQGPFSGNDGMDYTTNYPTS